jgi:hypothetical protein
LSAYEMDIIEGSIWKILHDVGKKLSVRKKWGEKARIDRQLYLIT